MRAIQEWLESGQDYAQGVALYDVHGRSDVVRKLLAYGETAFTKSKLVQVLEALVEQYQPSGKLVPIPAEPVRVIDPLPKQVEETDERVQVDPQRRAWFAERNYLHPQLELVSSDEERLAMALRILELGDLISQSYDQAAGRAPVPPPPGQVPAELVALDDTGEIRRRLANLRAQRSKLKNRPDRGDDLATVEASINVLEEKLKT